MNAVARRCATWLLVVLGGVWVAWLGFRPESLGDYGSEFAPAMNALLAGHLNDFSRLLPVDGAGGSLLLRAPCALAGKLLVGGQLAIFRFGTLSCELAAGGLGLFLARDMRMRGAPLLPRAITVGLCVLLAAILDAVYFAHPEETLGAALCVAAVLLAGADRPALAGVALGCALINKPWGVFAVPPVLLANPAGGRRCLAGAGAVVLPWAVLAYGFDPPRLARAITQASGHDVVAHPVGLWWPLANAVHRPGLPFYYAPPGFLTAHARELVVLLAIPLSLPLARQRLTGLWAAADARLGLLARAPPGPNSAATDAALALLALLLLLRCMLDPSNHVYYQVPFVLALLAWETRVRSRPVLALLATGLLWLVFHTISSDGLWVQYAAYMLVTLPLAIFLWRPASGRGWARPLPGTPRRPRGLRGERSGPPRGGRTSRRYAGSPQRLSP